jgi:non-lysosomal glucosylceramidase
MASYGVFLAACGYEYHGPEGHLAFAPRLTPEDFRSAFTAAEGWGTFTQKHEGDLQHETVELKWGRLRLRTMAFTRQDARGPASVRVIVNGQEVDATAEYQDNRVTIRLAVEAIIRAGQKIEVSIQQLLSKGKA